MKKRENNWGNRGNWGIFKILVILFILEIPVVSCDSWLDVIPDNVPTLDDAFSNRASAEKSLYSCYSYLPDPTSPQTYPAYFTNRDEFEFGTSSHHHRGYSSQIAQGEQNSNSPILNYWSGGNGGINLFQAIRTCNIFLESIHAPRDITEYDRKKWIAEVKFLKAYYHFFLMQLYGPIPLIKDNIPLSATPDEVRIFREPVDECVDYIAELIDEAVPDLPQVIDDPTTEMGRITKSIALAVKAKALVWGASPLFNGNLDYQGWRDTRGKQLIPADYNREKWVKAAEALRIAIDNSHEAVHELYQYKRETTAQTLRMNDSVALTINARKAISDRWNAGIIWASTYRISEGKGGFPTGSGSSDMQNILFPVLYAQDAGLTQSAYCLASFNMSELFYTKNGIPIDEDVRWNYDERYEPRLSTAEAGNGNYIPVGQQTASLHFDREARFYANLGFDRGFFELSTTTTDYGASFSMYVALRQGDAGNFFTINNTGYLVKKLIAFETKGNPYVGYDYRFPIIRLADLYLLYSEALNEIKEAPDAEVYEWIDKVRAIAGLNGVVDSWKNSRYPSRPSIKNEMRKIIQQERMIELAFEGQRFWDLRRWKLSERSRTYVPQGWNYNGRTPDEYYTVIKTGEGYKFGVRDYLWPVSISDLRVNSNLVQTWGW